MRFPPDRVDRLDRLAPLLAALITLVALLCVAATTRAVGPTGDEPAHLAAGMEWVGQGRYTIEPHHPPLTRIAAAAVPYAAGLRGQGGHEMYSEGAAILFSRGDYRQNIALARTGPLVFLVLGCLVVYLLARRVAEPRWAALAVALFATTPPVLAHAGLATTDMGIAAMLALTAWAVIAYLDRQTAGRAALAGILAAGALTAKMSALLFLPLTVLVVLACWFATRAHGERRLPRVAHVALGALACALTVWAVYRFSDGQLTTAAQRPHGIVTRLAPSGGPVATVLNGLVEAPIPAVEFVQGVRDVLSHHSAGHMSYLLGQRSVDGWWQFFPVAIGVKTPLALLIVGLVGAGVVLSGLGDRRRAAASGTPTRWATWLMLAMPLVYLASVMPSRINIGLRHVLGVYPYLAVLGALGLRGVLRSFGGRTGALATAAVLASQLFVVARAYPDYLRYFNPIAGPQPEQVLVYSDYDWGQDYGALADTLRARGITRIAMAPTLKWWITEQNQRKMGFPEVVPLRPRQPVGGWVALDGYNRVAGSLFDPKVPMDAYTWVQRYPRIEIGTIRLYRVPETAVAPPTGR